MRVHIKPLFTLCDEQPCELSARLQLQDDSNGTVVARLCAKHLTKHLRDHELKVTSATARRNEPADTLNISAGETLPALRETKHNGSALPEVLVEMVRVTEVLQEMLQVEYPWTTDKHFARGLMVHAICAHIGLSGEVPEDLAEREEEFDGYIAGYKKAKLELGFEVVAVEMEVCDKHLRTVGHLDQLVKWRRDEPVILELKTGYRYSHHPLQRSAYRRNLRLSNGMRARCIGIRLPGNGSYQLDIDNDPGHLENEWVTLVGAYWLRRKYGSGQDRKDDAVRE
jgi:hypothetical protein